MCDSTGFSRWMLGSLMVALAACGSDDSTGDVGDGGVTDGGADAGDGSAGDTGGDAGDAGDAGDGGDANDAGDAGDGDAADGTDGGDAGDDVADGSGDDCAPGATVSGEFGRNGGSLELCGATVTLEPGVVGPTSLVRLSRPEPRDGLPFPAVVVGPQFTLESTPPLQGLVRLSLPYTPNGRPVSLTWFTGSEWLQPEACEVTETTISQFVQPVGTWFATTATRDHPDSTNGLGEGTITVEFQGATTEIVLSEFDYAIAEGEGETRAIQIFSLQSISETEARNLRMQWVQGGEVIQLLSVQYGTTGDFGLWNWLQPVDGDPSLFALTIEGDRATGQAEVVLRQGEGSGTAILTFDVTTEAYQFPPSLSCPGGEDLP